VDYMEARPGIYLGCGGCACAVADRRNVVAYFVQRPKVKLILQSQRQSPAPVMEYAKCDR
jgi:hypothetical protein